MTDENQDAARDGDAAPRATIIDSDVRARLVDVARKAGLDADEFVEKLLLRLAETGVEFERGVCASGLSRRGRMMLASSASGTWPMTHEQLLDRITVDPPSATVDRVREYHDRSE